MNGVGKLAPGPGNIGFVERADPVPRPGEVVIAVHGAGLCGTDLHIEADEYRSAPPVIMGHEVSGVVADLGEGVEPSWLGARVVTETYFCTCGTCEWCRDGSPNLCPERRSIGSMVDGGFAPLVAVPVRNLHRIPDWLDGHAASLAEPLACVAQCLLDPAIVAVGDRVFVTGPGPIGLLAAQVARACGGDVVVTGLASDEARLAIARDLGFATRHAGEPEGPFDVVVECSGSAGGARDCFEAAGRRARYVQIGVFGKDVTVPLDQVFQKDLVLTSGFASTPRSWRTALDLIASRRVELAPLVSEVAPLGDWQRVFADARAGRGMKVVFDPRLGSTREG